MSNPLILNVNDNEQARYIATRMLTHAGYRVSEAATGEEALRKVLEKPDLVLLDVMLPDLNGFEVCRRIKSDPETASTSVLLLSAHATDSKRRVEGLETGAEAYLTQPVDGALLSATIRTILRVKRVEAELRSTVARLEQEKALRENFVLTLSHDLRNPLSAASTNAQLILRYPDRKEKHPDYARRITLAIDRADKMITDLLDASRIRVGEKLPLRVESGDLSRIVKDVVDDLRHIHNDRFVVEEHGDLHGYWSIDDLKRVLDNLSSNAIKYGAALSPVTIKIVGLGEQVSLCVHNEGKALSADEQKTVFDLFHRTRSAEASAKKGWGLGLPLVRGIAEAHGGRAYVESSPDLGTSFFVILPRDARPDSGANSAESNKEAHA